MGEIVMCGTGQSVASPPPATPEMASARKKARAVEKLREAEAAWREYLVGCELGGERNHPAGVFDRVRSLLRQ
jgi:hypothetical protein